MSGWGLNGRRISPFSWRIRYALAHKGLEPEVVPTRFADVGRIRALSGQELVPVLEHDGLGSRLSLTGTGRGISLLPRWCEDGRLRAGHDGFLRGARFQSP
jgi:hypothetical protein